MSGELDMDDFPDSPDCKPRASDYFPKPRLSYPSHQRLLLGLIWRPPYWTIEFERIFRPEALVVIRAPSGALLTAESGMRRVQTSVLVSTFEMLIRLGKPIPWGTFSPGERLCLSVTDSPGNPLGPEDVEMTLDGLAV